MSQDGGGGRSGLGGSGSLAVLSCCLGRRRNRRSSARSGWRRQGGSLPPAQASFPSPVMCIGPHVRSWCHPKPSHPAAQPSQPRSHQMPRHPLCKPSLSTVGWPCGSRPNLKCLWQQTHPLLKADTETWRLEGAHGCSTQTKIN